MTRDINIHYSIDRIYFERGYLTVDGWALGADEDNPIVSTRIDFADNRISWNDFFINYLNSPDVVSYFGVKASKARFSVGISIKSWDYFLSAVQASIVFLLKDGTFTKVRIIPEKIYALLGEKKFSVGVALTTYNRSNFLKENLEKIRQNSFFDISLIVSDDGSRDETVNVLENAPNIYWASSENRGVAWNKNRALFYSNAILSNSVTILMEDDIFPTKFGWDVEWVFSAAMYGHVNFNPPWLGSAADGAGQWNSPYKAAHLSGQCSVFSKEALAYVGYLDSRFGRYGHEHVEHTMRMIRAGYGGELKQENSRECLFYSISGDIGISPSESSFNQDDVDRNGEVFSKIWNESIYRSPWKDDDGMKLFRQEIQGFRKN